jgi:putative ABC transport system permease protein
MFNSGLYKDVVVGDRTFNLNMFFTNSNFFSLFGFTFNAGNAAIALNEPFSIVLTKELSDKLFRNENAIGKTVNVSGVGLFTVTGVLNNFPGKTHFEFEALASFSTVPALEKDSIVQQTTTNWKNYYTNYSYIRLKPGVKAEQAEAELARIVVKNYKGLTQGTRDAGYHFTLQPLNAITPGPKLSNNIGKGISTGTLWAFSILALVIILSAAFNYTNLTIAKAIGRVKEIAVRKITGSNRKQIFLQIIVESVMTSLLALAVAFILLQLLIPQFSSLGFVQDLKISFTTDATAIILFVGFAALLGLIAGLLPATILSRIHPLMLMQKLQNLKLFRQMGIRKPLLVIQFTISMIFISLVLLTYKQTQYEINTNFGSSHSHIFNVQMQGIDYDKAVHEFSLIPGVEKISAVSTLMGGYSFLSDNVRVAKEKDAVTVSEYFADENYIGNFNLNLIAGENFLSNHSQQQERYAIVNKQFVEQFKLGSPADAIVKIIFVGDSTGLIIRGVLKDFLYKPANYALDPMLVRYNPGKWSILNLNIAQENAMQTIARVKSAWKKLEPNRNFQGQFYDKEIQAIYTDSLDKVWMIAFIGILGITIACLGLLGITIFTVRSKTKEISIRKVVGASPVALFRLLTKSYINVMIIAMLLAIPISILLSSKILKEKSHHKTSNAGILLPGVLIVVLLSLLTISSQVIKAVLTNPVKGLKEE